METGLRIASLQIGYNLSERMIYLRNITRCSIVFGLSCIWSYSFPIPIKVFYKRSPLLLSQEALKALRAE